MNINETFKQPLKMTFNEPLKISNVNVDNIVYSKFKKSNDKKIILTKYNKLNFVFQTPTLLTLPKTSNTSLEVALVGKEKSKVARFLTFLNNLEKKVKIDAQMNAETWFDVNINTINFQKLVRESDNYSTGTLKLKLVNTPDFKTRLELNTNGVHKRIDYENIPSQSWCKMILECYAVWINSDNDFGIFLRPVLLSFTQRQENLYNYNFVDSDSDNEADVLDTEITSHLNMSSTNTNIIYNNLISPHMLDIVDDSSSDENITADINIIETQNDANLKKSSTSESKSPIKDNDNKDDIFINMNSSKTDIEKLVNHLELETTVSSNKMKHALEDDDLVQNDIISTSSS